MNQLRARATSWIDPLPERAPRVPPAGPAVSWFVLGGVSVVAVAALAIAACALRLVGPARGPALRGHAQ